MKTTFFYQFPGDFQHPRRGDAIWWPENCQRIDVQLMSYAGDELEQAAEAICVAEYKRGRDKELQRSGDTLMVYVTKDANIPGTLFNVTLYIEPSAGAVKKEPKRIVRLPNEAELAEATA